MHLLLASKHGFKKVTSDRVKEWKTSPMLSCGLKVGELVGVFTHERARMYT